MSVAEQRYMRTYGVPAHVLTDNGKVLNGRFAQPPVEVLFDRICRENGSALFSPTATPDGVR